MFENFVSLGTRCYTAASMAKYGLRSWSGVFDWLITPSLEAVLICVEKDFDGFLKKENLKRYKESPRMFMDSSSGFIFLHDKEFPFEEKYEELWEKYQKRIKRFLKHTTKETCFLRMVLSTDEIQYIIENEEYINRVIKKGNCRNEILFLVRKGIEVPKNFLYRYYIVEPCYQQPLELKIRSWFDQTPSFLEYCALNFSSTSIMKNIIFDHKKEEPVYPMRYMTLSALSKFDFTEFSLDEGDVVIYGAGNIGQLFYKSIKGKCNVKCFADKEKAGEKIDEIPIVDIKDVDYNEKTVFFVTATYDFQNICHNIKTYYDNAKIVALDDVLNK